MNVARLGPGQFFGEVEMMHDTQSIASVHAAESAVELVLVPKTVFQKLLSESTTAEDKMRQIAHSRREENLTHSRRNA
jgi:CRP-like cAMP-binding protein